jgi:hypothetical protein
MENLAYFNEFLDKYIQNQGGMKIESSSVTVQVDEKIFLLRESLYISFMMT